MLLSPYRIAGRMTTSGARVARVPGAVDTAPKGQHSHRHPCRSGACGARLPSGVCDAVSARQNRRVADAATAIPDHSATSGLRTGPRKRALSFLHPIARGAACGGSLPGEQPKSHAGRIFARRCPVLGVREKRRPSSLNNEHQIPRLKRAFREGALRLRPDESGQSPPRPRYPSSDGLASTSSPGASTVDPAIASGEDLAIA